MAFLKHYLAIYRKFSSINAPRVRFAPSPTGQLHLGGLRTALVNFLFAKKHKGQFILRIEDTDTERIVSGAVENLLDILSWLGLHFDEGPKKSGPYGPYVQTERQNIYKQYAEQLLESQFVYRCFCSPKRLDLLRKDAVKRREVPRYDNRCRNLSQKRIADNLAKHIPFTIRLRLQDLPDTSRWNDLIYGTVCHEVSKVEGDPVLLKSNGLPTYHLANVIDDHLMQITHILRGVEWQTSTPKHLLLYKAFGWQPPLIGHLPLVVDSTGKKLSKRTGSVFVENYRQLGYLPPAILNAVAVGAGFSQAPDGLLLKEMVDSFDFANINCLPVKINIGRIEILNRSHLRRMVLEKTDIDKIVTDLKELLRSSVNQLQKYDDQFYLELLTFGVNRIHKLSDFLAVDFKFLWYPPTYHDWPSDILHQGKEVAKLLQQVHERLNEFEKDDYVQEKLKTVLQESFVTFEEQISYAMFMKILRLSLSDFKDGPPVIDMLLLLKQHCLPRLLGASHMLNKLHK